MEWRMTVLLIVCLFSLWLRFSSLSLLPIASHLMGKECTIVLQEGYFWRLLIYVVPHNLRVWQPVLYYESIYCLYISVKWKDLHTWNSCSLVLPIFEYCCLNEFCNSVQSMFIDIKDLYHNLASPVSVKQNL